MLALNVSGITPHEEARIKYAYELLDEHCELVFVATTREQADQPALRAFPQIFDSFHLPGIVGGLLSALRTCRNVAWLAVQGAAFGLNRQTVAHLIVNRNPDRKATVLLNADMKGVSPEPIAIFEPSFYPVLLDWVKQGVTGLQEIFARAAADIELLPPAEALGSSQRAGEGKRF